MSTASPGARSPAPSMLAVPSLTPAMTGMPARRPSASAAAGRSSPRRCPKARAGGTTDGRTPDATSVRLARRRLVALQRGRRLARQPQAERVPRRQQPRRPIDAGRLLAGQPRHRRQQPEAPAARPPVLPRDRRPHRLPRRVDHRQRRALPHSAHGQDLDPVRRRSPAPTPRQPPTSPPATAPPGRRRPTSIGYPARPRPSRRPSSAIAAAFASVVPRSIPMTAGIRGEPSGTRPVGRRRHLLGEPEPAQRLEVRADLVVEHGRLRRASRPAAGAGPGLVEVARQPRLRLVVAVGRPGHAPVVVADVAQARRRLGVARRGGATGRWPARTGSRAAASSRRSPRGRPRRAGTRTPPR